jgi:hypothetical protein
VVAEGTLPTPEEGEAPDFIEPVRPVTVKEGENAVFSGRVSGAPKPDISWFKGNMQIDSKNPNYKIESSPDGTQKLTIFNVKKDDANAEIRCEGMNELKSLTVTI